MSAGELWAEMPKEPLIYELGGIVFASALLGFAHTTRRVLVLIGRRGAWILPALGAILMFLAVGLHAYTNYAVMFTEDMNTTEGLLAVYRFRFIALIAMLAASGMTLAGALVLWFSLTGFRTSAAPSQAPAPAAPVSPGA